MKENLISVENFIEKRDQYMVIDVRIEEQYKENHISGAVNIPLAEIKEKLNLIPKDKKIVTYCNGGTSGGIAALILIELGYDAKSLEGGIKNYMSKVEKI